MSSANSEIKIEAIAIETSNLEGLADFYQRSLDLDPPMRFNDDHFGFQLKNTFLGFDRVSTTSSDEKARIAVWFYVSEIQAAFDRLVEHGAQIKKPIHSNESGSESYAELFDPENNVIGLIQF